MGTNMYFSCDIETDGEAPGVSSMLSIGVVAIDPVTNKPCGEFYGTLKRLPDATPNTRTMEWWDQFPEQWAATRANKGEPKDVMQRLHEWVIDMCKLVKRGHQWEVGPTPVFVANPGGFDFSFVFMYLHKFLGESIFGFSVLCLQSYAAALLDIDFRAAGSKTNWPPEWISPLPHTHHALEDARSQADQMVRMMKWRRARKFVLVVDPTINTDDPVPPDNGP